MGKQCKQWQTHFFGSKFTADGDCSLEIKRRLLLGRKVMTNLRRRQWHPTPVLLPGKSHGWRSLVGCSPWGRSELDMSEQLHFHFSFSCIGEGNGNPLQCSCLENPRDGVGGPGGLPSMGFHRVGHDWSNLAAAAYWGTLSKSPHLSRPQFPTWKIEELN